MYLKYLIFIYQNLTEAWSKISEKLAFSGNI